MLTKVKNPYNEVEVFNKLTGLRIEVASGSSKDEVEAALQKFRRRIDKAGILDEYKERQFYVKPCLKKRAKRNKNAK